MIVGIRMRNGGSDERMKDQGASYRKPVLWKDAILHEHDEASEDLQRVGPQSWVKSLTESSGQNIIEMRNGTSQVM